MSKLFKLYKDNGKDIVWVTAESYSFIENTASFYDENNKLIKIYLFIEEVEEVKD